MKRKFELGRQPALTKVGEKRITRVRVRGGHNKFRALRLETGNFNWPGEAIARKTRILKVVYNATSNELVRTNTLVKGAIVQIDCAPFKQWYAKYYNIELGKKKEEENKEAETKEDAKADAKDAKAKKVVDKSEWASLDKKSNGLKQKIGSRNKIRSIDNLLADQFKTGRLYAKLTSRPGQSGRADGYILEGEELAFYQKKMMLKKKK
eukprot:TRINITY_DN1326_c0_g1_i2.p1 TRINITY_DN1326_c0_g1~~TRINITY_DN1326_c0_g1_i2.p1  ORF type:complete len:208 (+),score=62.72 TRINITY_DN1326_c0_g1_i2:217-840(+)